MSSVIHLSKVSKVAALTAVGGSFYFFRDEIKPFLFKNKQTKIVEHNPEPERKLIENLPEEIPYLLVGAGTASHAAMRAIRGHDPKAKVLMVGGENYNPYMRPALSKELWFSDTDLRKTLNFKWFNGKERSIFYEIDEFFIPLGDLEKRENGGVSIVKNMRLSRLDPEKRIAYLENGQFIKYNKVLLAPGGKPKKLPAIEAASDEIKDKVLYFRTADDFLRLDKISETAKNIVIIGGGFLGTELTFALANRPPDDKVPENQKITQIYPETGTLHHVLPEFLSKHVSEMAQKEGAHVIPNVEVKSVELLPDKSIEITLDNDKTIVADYIVCAIGLEPDVELAKSSGLEIDDKTGGFLVNSELEARSNVWVAGDASCFYDILLGRRRIEHHDHAINSGKLAGQNMIGSGKAYTHQSMFWSDLGQEISFEAVGLIDSSLPTVSVFTQPELEESQEGEEKPPANKYDKGIVFYLKDDIIVGILMWNLFSRLTIARRILSEQKKYDDFNEVAKLFNLYLEESPDRL